MYVYIYIYIYMHVYMLVRLLSVCPPACIIIMYALAHERI